MQRYEAPCASWQVWLLSGASIPPQVGGIGTAIIGFSRPSMGRHKSDIDKEDLPAFFDQDPHTIIIAQHLDDLKDARALAGAAKRESNTKPIGVLKAGRGAAGAAGAASQPGNDKIYEDVRSLRQLLEFARGIPLLPTPEGGERRRHHRRRLGRSTTTARRSAGSRE